MSTSVFVERAQAVHGQRYDYGQSVYTKLREKITIVCRQHGSFEQRASHHLQGAHCPLCSRSGHMTTETFIKRANKIHGDRYDYSITKYISNAQAVNIICKKHGPFEHMPRYHLEGHNCPKCAVDHAVYRFNSNEDFIAHAKFIHGDRFDYSETKYVRLSDDVTIICLIHGPFEQRAQSHIRGFGCRKCAARPGRPSYSQEDFLYYSNIAHGNRYDYSKAIYTISRNKVIIVCPQHGEFNQQAGAHMRGDGCPKCR